MKKTTFLLVFSLLSLNFALSQSIKFVRTDVDSVSSKIITATFVFGVDVVIDSLQNCTNVSFQLKYDNSQYIKFSGYRIGDFKKVSSSNVYLNPPTGDTPTNEQVINISVFSGLAPGENEFDSPNVLHLEFVVLQSAPIDQNVTFSFPKAEATAFVDSVARNIKLKAKNIVYKIHSFVDVWPGDANNDGLVNTDDYSSVGLYMRQGADNRNTRTFKRPNASTMWTSQRCILWDDAPATYADADGDGAVTVVDGLIVKLNDGLSKSVANTKNNSVQSSQKDYYNYIPEISSSNIRIPINTNLTNDIVAITGIVNLDNLLKDYDFKGIEKGESLKNIPSSILISYKTNDTKCEFFVTPNSNLDRIKSGTIANLILSPKVNNTEKPVLELSNLQAMKTNGSLTYLNLTNVEDETNNNYSIRYENDQIKISNLGSGINSIKIFSYQGSMISQLNDINSNIATFDCSSYTSGIYFAIINSKNENKILPILIKK
jgi:hypothetical protein